MRARVGTLILVTADDCHLCEHARRVLRTLGVGMHADTPGHAFALIEDGRVLWYRDYWLSPEQTMYVDPAALLADLPAP